MNDRIAAWVIERYQHNQTEYWSARKKSAGQWDRNHQWAIKFTCEDDALTVLVHLLDGNGRVTQHVWMEDETQAENLALGQYYPEQTT